GKRPDFTLADIARRMQIVEIKASGHHFDDKDFERLANYIDAFDEFFEKHAEVHAQFPEGYQITLIADGENIKNAGYRQAFKAAKLGGKVRGTTWIDFLIRTKNAHQDFLRRQPRHA